MAHKPTDRVPLQVRLRETLRRKIEKAAKANDCSLNSEVVRRLEDSFRLMTEPQANRLEEQFQRILVAFARWQDGQPTARRTQAENGPTPGLWSPDSDAG